MTDPDSTAVMAVKQVFEQRRMYDAVVAGNYMHHAELVAALAEWAQEFGRPLRIVDVGCGDASLAAKSFAGARVERYVGVDLAESSIEQARVSTTAWNGRVELICGNLFNALHGLTAGSANAGELLAAPLFDGGQGEAAARDRPRAGTGRQVAVDRRGEERGGVARRVRQRIGERD